MAKKTFNLSIKLDEATFRAIERVAHDKGRGLSPQGLHLIKFGFLLLDFCEGHDGFEHAKKVLHDCRKLQNARSRKSA